MPNANFPFLSNSTLVTGSFMGTSTEDGFMNFIWRLRQWDLVLASDLMWDSNTGIDYVAQDAATTYIRNGEKNTAPTTSEFSGPDDILCIWRPTILAVDAAFPDMMDSTTWRAAFDLFWGPLGQYSEDGSLGGKLSSSLLWTFPAPDHSVYLGTEEGATVPDGTLSVETGVDLVFDPDGDAVTIPLFTSSGMEGDWPGSFWHCGSTIYLQRGADYHEWIINGTPTWDATDGSQLADPKRNGANGRPLIYLCQQA